MVARAVTVFHHEERGGGSCCSRPSPPPGDPAEDLRCISTTFTYLHASGWYWGSISASEARDALLKTPEGTFLLRDSSHPKYILALSVKTRCGPTSVRIQYSQGSFWLDSISPGWPPLQSFPDVVSLVQHYASSSQIPQGPKSKDLQPETKQDTEKHADKDSGVPLTLTGPLHKPDSFPSLQHLARLTLNRHKVDCTGLLPKLLLCYLQEYPFHI